MSENIGGFGGVKQRIPKVADDAAEVSEKPILRKRATRKASQSRGRTSREAGARNNNPVHVDRDEPWTQPTSLQAPPPRKGYRQKWIRTSIFGRDDVQNVARKMREGWLPRKAETVPESFPVPTIKSGSYAGCIGVEGMVLCEMPEERVKMRNAHYRRLTEKMTQDIERNLQKINRAIPGHAGFGRVEKQAQTKTLTHARNFSDAEDEEA